jgi:hypothetical protein
MTLRRPARALVGVVNSRRDAALRRLISRLFRRNAADLPGPGPQGEDHEILVQERGRRRVNDLFVGRLIRKGDTPFLDEDLDDP